MSKLNRGDISIGQDTWITFVDTTGKQCDAVDLDPTIEPLSRFFALLETECVTECCGIDALGLWPDNIMRAAKEFADPNLEKRIVGIRDRIAEITGDVFVSHSLNNYFDKRVLLQLFNHLANCVQDLGNGEKS
jgi:hypothetical protein